jgi:hypothetical protein
MVLIVHGCTVCTTVREAGRHKEGTNNGIVNSLCMPRATTITIFCIGSCWGLQLIAQVSIWGSILQLKRWRSEWSKSLMGGCWRSASIRH